MSFIIQNISSKDEWERLVSGFKEANFLQSWNWGEFHESLGKKVYRIAVSKSDTRGIAQFVIERAKRGDYAAVYGGPLLDWKNEEIARKAFNAIEEHAKEEKCLFIRFRPQSLTGEVPDVILSDIKAKDSPMHLTADLTLQLDISESEDEIMAQMRKNHRYNIRRAERDGITTSISQDAADIEEFFKWQNYLAEKHGFVPFSKKFLKNQFEIFLQDEQAFLVHAQQGGELLASTFILIYNGEAVYHYGISTPKNDKQPGSYAALWRSIQEAKARGADTFNFWGISPEEDKDHRFAGVSLFKRGFGGREVEYLRAHDVPLSPLYWATHAFEKIRKESRGL